MRGMLYAASEIVVMMALATAIGAAIGVLVMSLRRDPLRARSEELATSLRNTQEYAAEQTERLSEAQSVIRELEGERIAAAEARDEIAALRAEIARLKVRAEDAERLQVAVDERDLKIIDLEATADRRRAAQATGGTPPRRYEATTVRTIVGNPAEAMVIFDLRDRDRERA